LRIAPAARLPDNHNLTRKYPGPRVHERGGAPETDCLYRIAASMYDPMVGVLVTGRQNETVDVVDWRNGFGGGAALSGHCR
jgi:hypothetical protein